MAKINKQLGGLVITVDTLLAYAQCDNTKDIDDLRISADVLKSKLTSMISTEVDFALSEFIRNEFKNID